MRAFYRLMPVAMAVTALLSAFRPAAAATIDYTVTFTAEHFLPSGAPINPVSGEFKFSLDTTLGSSGPVTGLVTKNALNLTTGALSFFYIGPSDVLVIGGDVNGSLLVIPGTNDIYLSIANFTSGGSFNRFVYSQIAGGYAGQASGGTVQVSGPPTAVTPIPAALPLFMAALGGFGFLGWRRRKICTRSIRQPWNSRC